MRLQLDKPFSRKTALAFGLTVGDFRGIVSSGVVRPMLHGVHVHADVPDSFELRCAAAALVLPPGGVLCRGSAAWLYGVDTRPPGMHHELPSLDVAVPRGVTPPRRRGLRCHVQELHG